MVTRAAVVLGAALLITLASACSGTATCEKATCSGCCNSGGKCESGTSTLACGANGLTCSGCGTGQVCATGICVSLTNGGGAGGGTGGGVAGGVGGGVAGGVGGGVGGGFSTDFHTPDGGRAVSFGNDVDPCGSFAAVLAEAHDRAGECQDVFSSSVVPLLTEAHCRTTLSSCSHDDLIAFDNVLNCMRRLDRCTAANRSLLSSRASVCGNLHVYLRQICEDAIQHP